ncbi:MAG: DEAD/DEAH box helicase family protein, partial [Bdellovibrionales bacterium]|nr:DEAD/DEAH box helicase family protein [Bdellovibrionales bacterium]
MTPPWALATPSPSSTALTCQAEMARLPGDQLSRFDSFKGYIETALRRHTWHKQAEWQDVELKDCDRSACLQLTSRSRVKFEVEVLQESFDPKVIYTSKSKTLQLPLDYDFSSPEASELLSSFLVGHELHPYMLGPESRHLRAKPAQAIALRAFHRAYEEGTRSFLHVAPTSAGKMFNIAKALKLTLNNPNRKHLSIVTVDRIDLVDQLGQAVQDELREDDNTVSLINGNEVPNAEILDQIYGQMGAGQHVVLAITTQSLKAILQSLEQEQLEWLAGRLNGLFLDEAHHFGAPENFDLLSQLLSLSSAFFYAATATPAHESVDFRSLFVRQHWSYLNTEENLFEEHEPEETFTQLRMAMEAGDVTPFDELYLVGEPNFDVSEEQPLFVPQNNNHLEMNPVHYQQLARMIVPLISDNDKGLIVAASIDEVKRLAEFMSEVFPDTTFEPYHGELSRIERKQVRDRANEPGTRHYLVAVKALDEGVNFPGLGAYIDLNSTLSVRQMVHRIGRILRLSLGKTSADVLFLSDFKEEAKSLNSLIFDLYSAFESVLNNLEYLINSTVGETISLLVAI